MICNAGGGATAALVENIWYYFLWNSLLLESLGPHIPFILEGFQLRHFLLFPELRKLDWVGTKRLDFTELELPGKRRRQEIMSDPRVVEKGRIVRIYGHLDSQIHQHSRWVAAQILHIP